VHVEPPDDGKALTAKRMKAVGDYDFGWRVLLGRMSPTSSNGSSTVWHWSTSRACPGWPHNKTSALKSSATTSMLWPSTPPVNLSIPTSAHVTSSTAATPSLVSPKFRDRVCGGPATADREAPETSERARRKARSHGERPRVSSGGLARSLWHNRGRSGRTGPPVPHRRGFVTAVEEARNYGLGFAVAQAKLRARIRWNRSRFSLAIFNTQAPACRTSLPGR
jgi:hypothetical protein